MTAPLNIAHRGGAQLWPENTLFAFESAAKSGYDGAELDVQLTRDDRLVVFHDFALKPELCRDADGRWLRRRPRLPPIRSLSLAELRKFDVGRAKPRTLYARRHSKLTSRDGERMPTLSEVIAAIRQAGNFRLFIELKTSLNKRIPSAPPEAVAEAVLSELRAARFMDRAVLVGFDWTGLIHAKNLAPEVPCWFSTLRRARIRPETIKNAGGDGWFCPLNRATPSAVHRAGTLGLAVGVWTVNQPGAMRRLLALGVDAVCTDRPDRLQPLLD
jgi:glycerophosphoryl diester phosphodiesterase